jgi:hypothetical protein
VRLDGRSLTDESGLILAQLGEDGHWYTAEGLPCHGLILPVENVRPLVAKADRDAAQRRQDRVWMDGAVEAITRLASSRREITSDDVWAALEMPPRESRMIGNALVRAQSEGLIEPTDEHRPSTRPENHSRPIRVWVSKRCVQQRLL